MAEAATAFLARLDSEPVLPAGALDAIHGWRDPFPSSGVGTVAALRELIERGDAAAVRSAGPRFFHFVMGGATPAALGADWLTSTWDQIAYVWASSPFASSLERVAVRWLAEMFDLPPDVSGVLTTGATMANVVGLSAARGWWAERVGIDVDAHGLASAPRPTIISSGYVHPSAVQAIGMLGLGRDNVTRLARDAAGRLDLPALRRELSAAGPAIVIANAGEVNAGDFDPIDEMASLAAEYGAWLHVDGAFGLFARVSGDPRVRALADGVERADSVTGDGHKWLNVPYDCGFAFLRERHLARLPRALSITAPYLPSLDDPNPSFGTLGPENSRRARALAVWATLRAYGLDGYARMVERHCALARELADLVDASEVFERLAEVPLNIVCFRARPPGVPPDQLDALNQRLGAALLADGRVFTGSTVYEGKVALRPAIVNWRTQSADIHHLVAVATEVLDGIRRA